MQLDEIFGVIGGFIKAESDKHGSEKERLVNISEILVSLVVNKKARVSENLEDSLTKNHLLDYKIPYEDQNTNGPVQI